MRRLKGRKGKGRVVGVYHVYRVWHDGRREFLFSKKNTIPYSWGFMACKAIGQGDVTYKASAAYVEYENVASGSDPVSIPSVTRASTVSYFNTLSGNRDFLRVALTGTPAIDIKPGYEAHFTAGINGNRCTFVAQTVGSVGVLGRPFSHVNNSKVCGIAIVATPSFADRSQDVILSRGYFLEADQQLKLSGSQIEVEWKLAFE